MVKTLLARWKVASAVTGSDGLLSSGEDVGPSWVGAI